jgi:hypothetical protein
VNTDRLITKNSSMRHVEGGWPKDVDFTEQSDVSRFRKKAEKDDEYKGAVKLLGPIIARCMKQNNTIDIYEVSDSERASFLRAHCRCRTISTPMKSTTPVSHPALKGWLSSVTQMTSNEQQLPLTGILTLQLLLRSLSHTQSSTSRTLGS